MSEMQETVERLKQAETDTRRRAPLPLVTNAERAFWRRAVEVERTRQRSGRPAPFPFQPA